MCVSSKSSDNPPWGVLKQPTNHRPRSRDPRRFFARATMATVLMDVCCPTRPCALLGGRTYKNGTNSCLVHSRSKCSVGVTKTSSSPDDLEDDDDDKYLTFSAFIGGVRGENPGSAATEFLSQQGPSSLPSDVLRRVVEI